MFRHALLIVITLNLWKWNRLISELHASYSISKVAEHFQNTHKYLCNIDLIIWANNFEHIYVSWKVAQKRKGT